MTRLATLIVTCSAALLNGCGDGAASSPDGALPDDAGPDAPATVAPGIVFHDFALAIDVSPDGKLAVFEQVTQAGALVMFHDTLTGEIVEKTRVGAADRAVATGISNAPAKLSALYDGEPTVAAVYSDAGWQTLASPYGQGCDQDLGGAFDISADGSVVVGLQWNGCVPVAFRWSAATGNVPLAILGTAEGRAATNRATVISDDGSTIAGFAENGSVDRTPAVWFADGTARLLDDNMDAPGEVLAISGDGKTLAGLRGLDAFVWTKGTGFVMLERLENYLPSDGMFANTMTADGEFVFGAVGFEFFTIPTAFVWSAADGTRALLDIAKARGIAIPDGVILTNVQGVSADGKVLAGTAVVNELPKTFTLRLP